MKEIFYKLLQKINQEKEGSSFYSIAFNLVNNLSDLDSISIELIADVCNVSVASVSRFFREIGYEDFYDFKYCFEHDIDNEIYQSNISGTNVDYSIDHEAFSAYYQQQVNSEIRRIFENLDYEILDPVIEDIYRYKKVYAMGLLHSNYACMVLQSKMMRLGKVIVTFVDPRDHYRYIHAAQDDTLVLIFSLTGKYLLQKLFKLGPNGVYQKDTSAKIVLFTNNKNFSKPYLVDQIVYLGGTVSKDNYKDINNVKLQTIVDIIAYRYGNYLFRLKQKDYYREHN
jgi:DNA-binding MurR/RpiR family transcriptional regulator